MTITSFTDAPSYDETDPGLNGRWTNLGGGAGSRSVGLRRIEVPSGQRSTPAHAHAAEEEIFYVLAGRGLLWQDGATCDVGEGDCIVHLPGATAHTLRAEGGPLDVLAFGERRPAELCLLPRTGWGWLGDAWVAAGDGPSPWGREAALPELEFAAAGERPMNVVATASCDAQAMVGPSHEAAVRLLGRVAGSRTTGLNHVTIAPGKLGAPLHCHSADEELFVILAGNGTLLLGDDEQPVGPGTVVSRPAGTRVAHAFRAGDEPLTLLAYGTRDPNDICFYPRSNKVFLRGVGVIMRVEQVDYWDGEV